MSYTNRSYNTTSPHVGVLYANELGVKEKRSSYYTFGFNGQEKENNLYGEGNAYDFGSRICDPRLGGRFFSIDPRHKDFPYLSPYCFAANSPIMMVDNKGEGPILAIVDIDLANAVAPFIAKGDYTGASNIIYNAMLDAHKNNKPSPVVNMGDAGAGVTKFMFQAEGANETKYFDVGWTKDPINLDSEMSSNIDPLDYYRLIKLEQKKQFYEDQLASDEKLLEKEDWYLHFLYNEDEDPGDPPEGYRLGKVYRIYKQAKRVDEIKGNIEGDKWQISTTKYDINEIKERTLNNSVEAMPKESSGKSTEKSSDKSGGKLEP